MFDVCFCLLISLSGRRENIAPDYPLTLLEGLTTITHYCLLDNKRVRNEAHTHTHAHRYVALISVYVNFSLFVYLPVPGCL